MQHVYPQSSVKDRDMWQVMVRKTILRSDDTPPDSQDLGGNLYILNNLAISMPLKK